MNLNRLIDRKVDHKDLKSVVDDKMDRNDAFNQFAAKQEVSILKMQSDDVMRLLEEKLHKETFLNFEKNVDDQLGDVTK